MKIKIKYFAAMREIAGKCEEPMDTNCQNALELYYELKKKYPFNMGTTELKVSKNRNYVEWNSKIEEGDEIVFIPPVAGG